MSPQEDIHGQNIEDITCLSTLHWLQVTLPTMHSIYLYSDIYQGLKSFVNSCIYIYICMPDKNHTAGALIRLQVLHS